MAIADNVSPHIDDSPARRLLSILSAAIAGVWLLAGATGDASGAQKVGGFEIQLVVTAEGRELFETWENPTGSPFEIVPVKVAPRGKFLSAVVLFGGCTADLAGNCDVELDIVAYDPEGNIYGEIRGGELWQHRPAPVPGSTQLGVAYMGLELELRDPAGTCRIEAVARDHAADKEARSTAQFEVE